MSDHTVRTASVRYILESFTNKDLPLSPVRLSVPSWQRSNRAWDEMPYMRSKLIETILMNLPVPPVWIIGSMEDGAIVDGLQRLTTLSMFLDGSLKLKLLDVLPQYNGMTFKDFSDEMKLKFLSYPLGYYCLNRDTEYGDKIGQIMFGRLNEGIGVSKLEKLDGEELGVGRDLIHHLSEVLGLCVSTKRWFGTGKRKHNLKYTLAALLGLNSRIEMTGGVPDITFWGHTSREGGTNPDAYFRELTYNHLNTASQEDRDRIETEFQHACKCLEAVFGQSMLDGLEITRSPKFNYPQTQLRFAAVSMISEPVEWWADNKAAIQSIFRGSPCRSDRSSFKKAYLNVRSALTDFHTHPATRAYIPTSNAAPLAGASV